MFRAVSFASALVAVFVGMYIYAQSARQTVSATGGPGRAQEAADLAASNTALVLARTALDTQFATTGSYAGVSVPQGAGLAIVHVGAASYCVQSGEGESARHLAGPGGEPAPGACPTP